MMGLVIGLATEALTGKGIVEQVWSFNQATAGIDFSFIVNFFSWLGEDVYLNKQKAGIKVCFLFAHQFMHNK